MSDRKKLPLQVAADRTTTVLWEWLAQANPQSVWVGVRQYRRADYVDIGIKWKDTPQFDETIIDAYAVELENELVGQGFAVHVDFDFDSPLPGPEDDAEVIWPLGDKAVTEDGQPVTWFQFAGPVIGVFGPARSGKDTFYKLLARHRSHVDRIAFADPLKEMCREIFDFSEAQLFGKLKDEPDERYPRGDDYLTPRYALQQLGTEWGRECYENVWVDYAFRKINERLSGFRVTNKPTEDVKGTTGKGSSIIDRTDLVVITDVRFINELKAVRAAGGYIVKLERPRRGLKGEAATHASERDFEAPEALEHVDVVIENDGSLDDYESKVLETLEALRL
jgi:hypothetical protein